MIFAFGGFLKNWHCANWREFRETPPTQTRIQNESGVVGLPTSLAFTNFDFLQHP